MIKLIDIDFDGIFDTEKIIKRFGYLPFYDESIRYCKSKKIRLENFGISHFDWYADITKSELLKHFKIKYKGFLK